jgi:hypothetical protein
MKARLFLSAALLCGFAIALPASAHAQQSGTAPAAGTPDAATKATPKARGKRKAAKDDAAATTPAPQAAPAKSGREAARERQRACGAEWKADKTAGKVKAGMKWPQYWSDCNKRKKEQGA